MVRGFRLSQELERDDEEVDLHTNNKSVHYQSEKEESFNLIVRGESTRLPRLKIKGRYKDKLHKLSSHENLVVLINIGPMKYRDSFHGLEIERRKRNRLTHQPFSQDMDVYSPPFSPAGGKPIEKGDFKRSVSSMSTKTDETDSADKDGKPKEYKIVISTEINGRTVVQRTVKVPPYPPVIPTPIPKKLSLIDEDED